MSTHHVDRLSGGGLEVRFSFHGDRYTHEVGFVCGRSFVRVFESIESAGNDDWPASPPLQSMHVQYEPDGRQCALLVGMACQCHWSASVALDPRAPSVYFEFACRLHGTPPGSLGNLYRSAWPLTESSASEAHFSGGQSPCSHWKLRLDECFGGVSFRADRDGLAIVAAATAPHATRQTIRWAYWLAPAESAPLG